MKMRYKILAGVLSLGLASCSMLGSLDDLDIEYVQTDDTVISDAASAENLLAGVYVGWKTFGVSAFFANQSLRSGANLTSGVMGANEFEINTIQDTNAATEAFYPGLYLIINNANSFIAALQRTDPADLSEARKAEMLAEAYFNKALAEYYLLCTFGEFYDMDSKYGIVIWNEPVRGNVPRARSTVKESYATILDDLKNADAVPAAPGPGRAGKYAVMALRAKVLLYMKEFAKAAEVAGELIAANDSALEGSFLAPFAKPYSSREVLFDLYCTYPGSTLSGISYSDGYNQPGYPLTALADELVGDPDDGILSEADPQLYIDWLGEDPENEAAFIGYMNEMLTGLLESELESIQDAVDFMKKYILEEAGEEIPDEELEMMAWGAMIEEMLAPFIDEMGVELPIEYMAEGFDMRYILTYDPVKRQGLCKMSKYVYSDFPSEAGNANTIFFLRMADVYYVKAEAEARQGNLTAARSALARVLERAEYDEAYVNAISDDELVATIMKHRYMENFTENQDDYFDQVRAFKWDGANFCDNELVEEGRTLIAPVPRAARAGNPLLEQIR